MIYARSNSLPGKPLRFLHRHRRRQSPGQRQGNRAMTVSPDPLPAYMEKSFSGSRPPLVLIPTTAGTGSEATKFTIITDTEKQVKMLLKGEMLLPDLAVIDPAFTLTAPPSVTAATGMDALPTQWSLILPESIILSPICMPCQRSAGFSAVCPGPSRTVRIKKPGKKWHWPLMRQASVSIMPPSPSCMA